MLWDLGPVSSKGGEQGGFAFHHFGLGGINENFSFLLVQ